MDRETGATVVPTALRSVMTRVTLNPEENASVQRSLGFTGVTQLSGGGITFRIVLLNASNLAPPIMIVSTGLILEEGGNIVG